ncbi:hypothetical protein GMO_26890 [Gluconobacter morbifer G707]|uniref:Uncharacterized protein n=1 Tax=Gluconobacter morbifer G707 TaxID=1088869 RepID=G6XMH1_9PROT|nr:hypothetical protein GMO_26890 [Gluconobacter morbifer G707]
MTGPVLPSIQTSQVWGKTARDNVQVLGCRAHYPVGEVCPDTDAVSRVFHAGCAVGIKTRQ